MAKRAPHTERVRLESKWRKISSRFTRAYDDSWAYGGKTSSEAPKFGWKLHVSATITNASDVLAAVGPYLKRQEVCFKVPRSLAVLSELNQGIGPSYCQVGKFLTVYPSDEAEAVRIANQLDSLTNRFNGPVIPFDRRLHVGSLVYYRFGAFVSDDPDDEQVVVGGKSITDDRHNPVPVGLDDPFRSSCGPAVDQVSDVFSERFRVFDAFSQRGKGGAYHAIDTLGGNPRIVVIKEGRRNGETSWDGTDGFDLIANEFSVLTELHAAGIPVPRPIEYFEFRSNAYCAMEAIEGVSLEEYLARRVRRLSLKRVICFAVQIAEVILSIESAGWRWGDCKPSNLIICPDGTIRPIDFEGAHRLCSENRFVLQSPGFSDHSRGDSYSLGAITHFLIFGDSIDAANPAQNRPPRPVPPALKRLIDELLSGTLESVSAARDELLRILAQTVEVGTIQNTSKPRVFAGARRDRVNHPTREVGKALIA